MLFLILTYLWFMRISISVDSQKPEFKVRAGILVTARALTDPDDPTHLRFHVLGIPFSISIWKQIQKRKRKRKKKEQRTKKPRKRSRRSPNATWSAMQKIFCAIRINYLRFRLDTGDAAWNGIAIPVVAYLNHRYRAIEGEISFSGDSYVQAKASTSAGAIAMQFIKPTIKTKQNGNQRK